MCVSDVPLLLHVLQDVKKHKEEAGPSKDKGLIRAPVTTTRRGRVPCTRVGQGGVSGEEPVPENRARCEG